MEKYIFIIVVSFLAGLFVSVVIRPKTHRGLILGFASHLSHDTIWKVLQYTKEYVVLQELSVGGKKLFVETKLFGTKQSIKPTDTVRLTNSREEMDSIGISEVGFILCQAEENN